MKANIAALCQKRASNFAQFNALVSELHTVAAHLTQVLINGNKILLCGNGGSAADSQHLAAELVGRFKKERAPLPAIALTTNTSTITAIANDYDFASIFTRQIEAIGQAGDALIAISTSGNSNNIIAAVQLARARNISTIALTGGSGGKLRDQVDFCLSAPSNETDLIQEFHIAIGHILCDSIESHFPFSS